jgi:hypothetical protein
MAEASRKLFCRRIAWQGRKAYALGNGNVSLTALCGGGHIADMRLVNGPDLSPLWVPPWPTIEPYEYFEKKHGDVYGSITEGKLLSGLAGHNICLDYFGSPSPEEAAQGLSQHGEAPSSKWRANQISVSDRRALLELEVKLPVAGLEFSRKMCLKGSQPIIYFTETVHNLRKADHFFHWTQHVTLGPQFLQEGQSSVALPGERAITFPHGYDEGKALLASNSEFLWPKAPLAEGGTVDLTSPFLRKGLGFVVAVQLSKDKEFGFIAAVNRALGLLIAYCFKRIDFPWVAIWEENLGIAAAPWKQRTQARGLEFSTTPLPVPRREAFMSGHLFGQATQTVVPALSSKTVAYVALLSRVPKGFQNLKDVEVHSNHISVLGDSPSEQIVIHAPAIRWHFSYKDDQTISTHIEETSEHRYRQ